MREAQDEPIEESVSQRNWSQRPFNGVDFIEFHACLISPSMTTWTCFRPHRCSNDSEREIARLGFGVPCASSRFQWPFAGTVARSGQVWWRSMVRPRAHGGLRVALRASPGGGALARLRPWAAVCIRSTEYVRISHFDAGFLGIFFCDDGAQDCPVSHRSISKLWRPSPTSRRCPTPN